MPKVPQESPPVKTPSTFEKWSGSIGPVRKKSSFADWQERSMRRGADFLNRQREGMEINQDVLLRVHDLSVKLKVPFNFVAQNFDKINKAVKPPDFNWKKFNKDSPIVFDYLLKNPRLAGMKMEDLNALGGMEKLLNTPSELWPLTGRETHRMATTMAKARVEERILDLMRAPMVKSLRLRAGVDPLEPTTVTDEARREMFLEEFEAAAEELRLEEAFSQSDEKVGFVESIKNRFRENPAFWVPFAAAVPDTARVVELYNAAAALEGGTETQQQRDLLIRFGRLALATERRGHSFWGSVAEVAEGLPSMAGEFAATWGTAVAIRKAIVAGGKRGAETFLRRAVQKVLKNKVGGFAFAVTAQTALQTPLFMPQGFLRRRTYAVGLTTDQQGRLDVILGEVPDDSLSAFAKTLGGGFVENISEQAGLGIMKLKYVFMRRWIRMHPTEGAVNFLTKFDTGTKTLARVTGWHGPVAEVFEEDLARYMRAGLGIEEAREKTLRDYLVELTAFSIPSAARFGIRGSLRAFIRPRKPSNEEFFLQLSVLAKSNPIFGQNPLFIEEIVREATGERFFYVPIKSWNRIISAEKLPDGTAVNPRDVFVEITGESESYQEATETESDLQIPAAKYVARISRSDVAESMAKETKADPAEITPSESDPVVGAARDSLEVFDPVGPPLEGEEPTEPTDPTKPTEAAPTEPPTPEQIESEIAEQVLARQRQGSAEPGAPPQSAQDRQEPAISAEQAAEDDAVRKIFDAVLGQLTQADLAGIPGLAGLTISDLESMALLTAERFRRRAEVLGIDPAKLWEEAGLQFGQAEGQPEARGRTLFGPTGINVEFWRNAGLGTFLHETGHIWLEEIRADIEFLSKRPDADLTAGQRQLIEDGQTILGWLGVKSWAEVASEHHEKWALEAQKYFLEGKAPSKGLRRAFERFRRWMVELVVGLKISQVELSPEVSSVMDRLLASETEIEAAEAEQNLDVHFVDPRLAGATEKQAERFEQLLSEVKAEAMKRMLPESMDGIRQKRTKEWQDLRAAMRDEIAKELSSDRPYVALSVLTAGRMPDGSAPNLPSGAVGLKLSRNGVAAEIGPEAVGLLPPSLYAEDGASPGMLAGEFGFRTGRELFDGIFEVYQQQRLSIPEIVAEQEIRDRLERTAEEAARLREQIEGLPEGEAGDLEARLASLRAGRDLMAKELKRAEAASKKALEKADLFARLLDAMADERMEAENPDDFFDEDKMRDEAIDSLHNENRSELLHLQLEIMTSERFSELKELGAKLVGAPKPLKLIREDARRRIARKVLSSISPTVYRIAEQKAGREARDAFLSGDFQAAVVARERQLLNHELYLAAREQIENMRKAEKYMRRFSKPDLRRTVARAGHDYIEQIDAILDRYEFKRVSAKTLERRKRLLDWMDQQEKETGRRPDVPAWIVEQAQRMNYRQLTGAQLQELVDSVKMIEHLAKRKDQMLRDAEEREFDEITGAVIGGIRSVFGGDKRPISPDPKLEDGFLRRKWNELKAAFMKMEFLFMFLDGEKPQGPAFRNFFLPFADSEDTKSKLSRETSEKIDKILEPFTRREKGEMFSRYNTWFTKKIYVSESVTYYPDGKVRFNGEFTMAGIIAVALNTGARDPIGKLDNYEKLKEGHGWTDAQIQAILSHMEERHFDMVQQYWDLIDSFWPAVSDMERKRTGRMPRKVQATPFTRFGKQYRGGYYPIMYNGKLSWRQGKLDKNASVQEAFGGDYFRAMTWDGYLEERKASTGEPILLSLSVLNEHLGAVIHDIAFRDAVEDVWKLANDPGVRDAIIESAGLDVWELINPWLHNIARDRPHNSAHVLEELMGMVRAGSTVVNLGLKMTTGMLQTLGLTRAAKELGIEYISKGVRKTIMRPGEWTRITEFINSRSEMMRDRPNQMDRDMRDYVQKLGVVSGMRKAWFYHIGLMDLMVSRPTWMGAYEKAMDGEVENVRAGDEKRAIEFADSTVRMSQAAGAAKDLARVQTGSEAWKIFSMFYTEQSTNLNQYTRAHRQNRFDPNLPRLMASYTWLAFVPAVLEPLMRGEFPDDDEDYVAWLVRKQVFYPLGSVLLVRDAASMLEWEMETGRISYQGSPAFAIVTESAKAFRAMRKVASGEELTRWDVKGSVMASGYVSSSFLGVPIPSRQLWLTGEYLHDWMMGREEPDNPLEGAWRALITGKPRD